MLHYFQKHKVQTALTEVVLFEIMYHTRTVSVYQLSLAKNVLPPVNVIVVLKCKIGN